MSADLVAGGATPEQLAQLPPELLGAAQEEHFEVLADNWLAVQIFLDLSGQWTKNINGVPEAIGRADLQATLCLWPVRGKQRSDIFHQVRVLEGAAAQEYRRRAKGG